MRRPRLLALLLSAGLLALQAFAAPADAPTGDAAPAAVRLRRPVALALVDGGKRLLVANRDAGTVAVLDTERLEWAGETRFGRRPSDMAVTPDGGLVLLTDEEAGELIVVEHRQGTLREARRWKVGPSPVGVRVADDGRLAAVACLWPRRLTVLDLADAAKPAGGPEPYALDLPFAPRRLLAVPGGPKVIVADSFAGQLAVADLKRRAIDSIRPLPAHNVRGLALDRRGKTVLLAHQRTNSQGHTTSNEIRNGNVLTNNVRKLSLADVLDPSADVTRNDRLFSVGDVEGGAGDPGDIAEGQDGHVLVTLSGVDELAVGRPEEVVWTRLAVGRRPTALAVDAAGQRAYVANTFGDSVSVVDLRAVKVVREVPLGKPGGLRRRSAARCCSTTPACRSTAGSVRHSCHPDGHSNGRLNDNFTDGSFGTPKRILSLLGVKDTGPWAWDGKMTDLETQVRNSVKNTMQGPAPSPEQVRDLAAFLRTLPPAPSLLRAREAVDPEALKRGRRVFARQKCATCHAPPAYTSARTTRSAWATGPISTLPPFADSARPGRTSTTTGP